MIFRPHTMRSGSPNFYALYGCGLAFVGWCVWPEGGGALGNNWDRKMIGFIMGGCAALSFGKMCAGFRLNQYRRRAFANAHAKTDTLGGARFASAAEIAAAGLFDLANPILVGMRGLPLALPKQTCLLVTAPRGAAKSSALMSISLIQALMSGSGVIIQDVKGEFYGLWAGCLEALGFRIFVSNLARDESYPVHDSNPYAPLISAAQDEQNWHHVFIISEALSRAIIKDASDSKSEFFKNGDRSVHIAVAVALALLYPERCTPAGIYRTILNPKSFEELMIEARASDALAGDLSDMAAALLDKRDEAGEHLENFRSGAASALSLYKPSSKLGHLGALNNFDVATLRDPKQAPAVIFDVFPGDQLSVYGPANALVQSSRIQTLRQYKDGRHVLMLIDEATAAPLKEAVEAIELSRSWNIDVVLSCQSEASLIKTYGKDGARSIQTGCAEIFFGVSDLARAKEISERIGKHTIKTTSSSFDEAGKPGISYSESATSVMSPEEILAMPKHEALLLYPNLRPIKFQKTPWFEIEPFKNWAGENPHERGHARSRLTHFTLDYPQDARALRAPKLKGQEALRRKLARSERQDHRATKPKNQSWRMLRDFIWIPLVVLIGVHINRSGTPHILLESYGHTARSFTCRYVGLSGLRLAKQSSPCTAIQNIRFRP